MSLTASKKFNCIIFFLLSMALWTGGVRADEDVAEVQSDYEIEVPKNQLAVGAAEYSYKIAVPPGRNGLTPEIALYYNSSAGNGWLGVGWQLDMGAIVRQTKHGLDYRSNDFEFSIAGQNSELVQRDEWGDFYYGAKIENQFSKYFRNTLTGGWEVYQKDGRVYYYGSSTDSRQQTTKGKTFKWCLDKVIDSNGNEMILSYDKDQGAIYLREIYYDGGNTISFIRDIDIRSDQWPDYRYGTEVIMADRLQSIEIQGNDQYAGHYELLYEEGQHTHRSRIQKIVHYGSDGVTTLPAMTFTYKPGSNGEFDTRDTNISIPSICMDGYGAVSGDFNGDSHTDVFIYQKQNSNYNATTWLADSDAVFTPQTHQGFTYDWKGRWGTGDFNGDGLSDLTYIVTDSKVDLDLFKTYKTTPYLYFADGDGSFNQVNSNLGIWNTEYVGLWMVGDYNGDGLSDFVQNYAEHYDGIIGSYSCRDSTRCYIHGIRLWLSNGDGTFNDFTTRGTADHYAVEVETWPNRTPRIPSKGRWMTADINGDGRTDLVNNQADAMVIWLSRDNNEFFIIDQDGSGGQYYFDLSGKWLSGDLNGDGLDDIVKVTSTGSPRLILSWLSRGDGSFVFNSYALTENVAPLDLMDTNGDGMDDLVAHGGTHNAYYVLISDGRGNFDSNIFSFSTQPPYYGSDRTDGPLFGDFNGDGNKDVMIARCDDSPDLMLSGMSGKPGQMERFSIEKGATIDFQYDPSSIIDNSQEDKPLPFVAQMLTKLTVNDGVDDTDQPAITRYEYYGGLYDFVEREFRGFEWTKQFNPDGSVEKHYFHQDFFRQKRTKLMELWSADPNIQNSTAALLSKSTYEWPEIPAQDTWGFVRVEKERIDHYDDQQVFSEKDYTYCDGDCSSADAAGNVTKIEHSGTGAEKIIQDFTYDNFGFWNWRKTSETTMGASETQATREVLYRYYLDTGNLHEKEEVNHGGDNPIWRFDYDQYGNVKNEYDANGNPPTHYEYDYSLAATYPVQITNPAGHVTQKEWDYRYGREIWVVDPNGQQTDYAYDPFGRLTSTSYPDGGHTEKIFYDICQDQDCTQSQFPLHVLTRVKENDASYVESHLYYDGLGRRVQEVTTGDNGYFVSKTHYDEMGRAVFETGPFQLATDAFLNWQAGETNYPINGYPYVDTTYDLRGRPTLKQSRVSLDGGGQTMAFTSYDYAGFDVTITDPDGCRKTEKRDHLERIVEVVDHSDSGDIHTRYVNNSSSDLLEVRNHFWNSNDPNKNRTKMIYNSLGRKTAMIDPDMGAWSYQYDLNGNMKLQTDAKGQQISFDYDSLNRIKLKRHISNNSLLPDDDEYYVTCVYDNTNITVNGIGRLSMITDGQVTPSYSGPVVSPGEVPQVEVANDKVTTKYLAYDPLGRQKELTKFIEGAAKRTTLYDYDLSGKVTQLTYPHTDGQTPFYVDYDYHPGSNLLHAVIGSDGTTYAALTDYQPSGKIGDIVFGNGVHTDYTYDGWSHRLTDIHTTSPAVTDPVQDRKYTYSLAGDITEIDDRAKVETYFYTYDKLHQLTSETTSFGSFGVTSAIMDLNYDDPEHVHAVSSVVHKGVAHDYAYDANGNMQIGPDFSDPSSVANRELLFNADNMPVSVVHSRGGTISLVYDGESKRAKKTGPGGTTYYFSNEFEIIDNVETKYIFAGNLRIAKITDSPVYFHKDHLGSSTAMTDGNGSVSDTAMYMPYGGKRGSDEISVSSYKFTDQELDKASGLYNYDARLYDPVVGRFISPDSIVPGRFDSQAFDRYAYTLNNPLKYTDPSGHFIFCATAIAIGVTYTGVMAALDAAVIGSVAWGIANTAKTLQNKHAKTNKTSIAKLSKRTSSKDKRAKNKETTEQQKENDDHYGDSSEAHKSQKDQGSIELTQKEQGIKAKWKDQDAHKTRTNMKEKMKEEAQRTQDDLNNTNNDHDDNNGEDPDQGDSTD